NLFLLLKQTSSLRDSSHHQVLQILLGNQIGSLMRYFPDSPYKLLLNLCIQNVLQNHLTLLSFLVVHTPIMFAFSSLSLKAIRLSMQPLMILLLSMSFPFLTSFSHIQYNVFISLFSSIMLLNILQNITLTLHFRNKMETR